MLDTLARFQFFIYPLVVHLSVVYQAAFISACLLPLFYLIVAQPFAKTKKFINTQSIIFFVLSLIALLSYYFLDHSVIYLPPIIMISLILYPFFRSVMPGNTPLLSRFYQMTEQQYTPDAMTYTKHVTWIWVIVIILLLLNTLFLTFFASLQTWSLFTNFINYILMLALFIVEWLFRMVWFQKWFSPIRFIQQLMTIDQRELLR